MQNNVWSPAGTYGLVYLITYYNTVEYIEAYKRSTASAQDGCFMETLCGIDCILEADLYSIVVLPVSALFCACFRAGFRSRLHSNPRVVTTNSHCHRERCIG